MECVGIFVVIFLIVGAGIVVVAYQHNVSREAAKKAYHKSLSRLRNNPNNASQRQETLELGRVYSNLTRNNQGITVFDEVALKNDIDAACAGAVTTARSAQQLDGKSVPERLASLDELRKSSMITDAEYNERRKRILDSI